MAKFAELNENNIVTQIIVVDDQNCCDDNNEHSEAAGQAFCQELFGSSNTWKETSVLGNSNKNAAGIGYSYDAEQDVFIPPQPYNSWTLNTETWQWQCPVPYPPDSPNYVWNEDNLAWELQET